MKVGAIIPAAGRGTRVGVTTPKQFLELQGKPLIHHTLKIFASCEVIDYVVLVMPQIDVDESGNNWLDEYEVVRKVVAGGQKRQDSVYNGFYALEGSTEIVVVHDGVRPFTTSQMIANTVEAAKCHGAAITAEGLSELNPDFYIFFVPLLFENYDEVDYIRSELRDGLINGIRGSGFELLMFNDVGWVYWFTTLSMTHPEQLKNHKIFNWAGDYKFSEIWKKAGYQAVPLASIDILPGLQTGLIDAVSTNPQFALVQQMFGISKNMLDLKWGLLTGGVILDSKIFNKMSSNDRESVINISREFEKKYQTTMRYNDGKAIEVMKELGLTVNTLTNEEETYWRSYVGNWYPDIQNIFKNQDLFDKIVEIKESYKKKIADTNDSE